MPMEEKLLFQGSLIYTTFPLSSLPTMFYVDLFIFFCLLSGSEHMCVWFLLDDLQFYILNLSVLRST